MEKRCAFPFLSVFLLTLLTSFNIGLLLFGSNPLKRNSIRSILKQYVSTQLIDLSDPPPPPPHPPRFAYHISGSKGDLEKLWRILRAIYHPWNQYLIHLDLEAPVEERLEIASRVQKDPVFSEVGNVRVVTKANMVTYTGPTMVSNYLHGCAIFLRMNNYWDCFINLSASDYPLVTQDDLIHAFSKLDRNLSFIQHTSKLGWKKNLRGRPVIVDPGIYLTKKSNLSFVKPYRDLPTAFKVFTGSAWMVLSRPFVEYTITGWENLPRTLSMYFTNYISSAEGYFTTLICNSPALTTTVVNHDLHYIAWPKKPPTQHPVTLSLPHFEAMVSSNAAFARKFAQDDAVLDKIDRELLGGRMEGGFTPGGWCSGDLICSRVGDPTDVRPGFGAERLGRLLERVVFSEEFKRNQCK